MPVVKGQVDYRPSTRALTATVVWASAWLMAWIASGTVLTAAAATLTCTASFPRVAPAVSGDLPGQAAKAVNTVTRSQTRKAILQKDAKRPFGLGNRFTGTMDQRRGRPSAATLTLPAQALAALRRHLSRRAQDHRLDGALQGAQAGPALAEHCLRSALGVPPAMV